MMPLYLFCFSFSVFTLTSPIITFCLLFPIFSLFAHQPLLILSIWPLKIHSYRDHTFFAAMIITKVKDVHVKNNCQTIAFIHTYAWAFDNPSLVIEPYFYLQMLLCIAAFWHYLFPLADHLGEKNIPINFTFR